MEKPENMEDKLFEIASRIKKPISIASITVIALFLLFRGILALDIFGPLGESTTFTLILSMVNRLFYLAVLALLLGFLSYVYTQNVHKPLRPVDRKQVITGNVLTSDRIPVKGAIVFVEGNDRRKETDDTGWFTLEVNEQPSWTVRAYLNEMSAEITVTRKNLQKPIRLILPKYKESLPQSIERVTIPRREHRYFERPQLIASISNNYQEIPCHFLEWMQCTILMWVLVPPKGESLRGGPTYRYLMAYRTHIEGEKDHNVFALRYFPPEDSRWGIWISNSKAESLDNFTIHDDLKPGWHHFLIRWNHSKPELAFYIDMGSNGHYVSDSYRYYWPEPTSNNVFIGSWVAPPKPFSASYCETQIFDLLIIDQYLEFDSDIIKAHFNSFIDQEQTNTL